MELYAGGSRPTRRGPAQSFTGTVWQDPIIEAPAPARIRSGRVSFEPGARNAWHTHPLGQTLHVLAGVGRVQLWGGPVREIRAGDTVWIAPNDRFQIFLRNLTLGYYDCFVVFSRSSQ